jgi:hypothetical protein
VDPGDLPSTSASTISGILHSIKSASSAGTSDGATNGLELLLAKVERLSECMEYLKSLINRITQVVKDVAGVEDIYSAAAVKVLASHGASKNRKKFPLGGAIEDSAREGNESPVGNGGGGIAGVVKSYDILCKLESPSTKAGWLSFFRIMEDINDIHAKTGEYYMDEIVNRLEVVFRQVEVWKKDLQVHCLEKTKALESAQNDHSQVQNKLQRVQTQLKERRNAIKVAKEKFILGGVDDDNFLDGEYSEESSISITSAADRGATEAELKKKRTMMKGLENFSSSLANGKFKMAVGLETQVDRIARIERTVVALESEEAELLESIKVASATLEQLIGE